MLQVLRLFFSQAAQRTRRAAPNGMSQVVLNEGIEKHRIVFVHCGPDRYRQRIQPADARLASAPGNSNATDLLSDT